MKWGPGGSKFSTYHFQWLTLFVRRLPVDAEGYLLNDTKLSLAERLGKELIKVNEKFDYDKWMEVCQMTDKEYEAFLKRSNARRGAAHAKRNTPD